MHNWRHLFISERRNIPKALVFDHLVFEHFSNTEFGIWSVLTIRDNTAPGPGPRSAWSVWCSTDTPRPRPTSPGTSWAGLWTWPRTRAASCWPRRGGTWPPCPGWWWAGPGGRTAASTPAPRPPEVRAMPRSQSSWWRSQARDKEVCQHPHLWSSSWHSWCCPEDKWIRVKES